MYDTREELLEAVKKHALSQGYCTAIKSGNPSRNVAIHCVESGEPRWDQKPTIGPNPRIKSSKRKGCPFLLYGSVKKGKWHLQIRNPDHNHPANPPIVYPQARKFTSNQIDKIQELSDIAIAPRKILQTIRSQSSQPIRGRDIYNQIALIRREERGYQSETKYLITQLNQKRYKYRIKLSSNNKIELLALTHPATLLLANKYNRVFILDCTYKTNRYQMPFLEVIGITPTNQSFLFAVCFIQNEQTEGYQWALETLFQQWLSLPQNSVLITDRDLAFLGAINAVLPNHTHLLCIWHINISSKMISKIRSNLISALFPK